MKLVRNTEKDLKGQRLRCITNKYGNFTLGRIYEVHQYMSQGVFDNYGDYYPISDKDLVKIFRIEEY